MCPDRRVQAALCRSVSISLSQDIIWFQLGMLWDAKLEFEAENTPRQLNAKQVVAVR